MSELPQGELQKMIEGIKFPVRYDKETQKIYVANGGWLSDVTIGEDWGYLIAAAINNLQAPVTSEPQQKEEGLMQELLHVWDMLPAGTHSVTAFQNWFSKGMEPIMRKIKSQAEQNTAKEEE
jgi:hypothetical protein